jgi:signal transduction histidine kinase
MFAPRLEANNPHQEGVFMKRKTMFSVVVSIILAFAAPVFAGNFGTADEAKAMLERAAAALKANQAKALVEFTKGEGGFKDRDLYPFCGGPDGNFTAHPTLVGKSLKDLKDKAGKPLGQDIYAAAKPGAISQVSYMWPRPGTTEPVQKVSFVTKVGDQVCAVGYYK